MSRLEDAREKLYGVALRQSGGVYWIPEKAIEPWGKVAAVVERACPGSAIYTIGIRRDEQSARLLTAAVRAEITAEVEAINGELDSGEMGQRAVRTRKARLEELEQRAAQFEAWTGHEVSGIRDVLADM